MILLELRNLKFRLTGKMEFGIAYCDYSQFGFHVLSVLNPLSQDPEFVKAFETIVGKLENAGNVMDLQHVSTH